MGGSIKKCKQESGLAWSSECPYFISFLSITAAGTLNPSLAVRGQNPESQQPVSFPPSWFFYLWDLDAGREVKDSKQRKRQRGFPKFSLFLEQLSMNISVIAAWILVDSSRPT